MPENVKLVAAHNKSKLKNALGVLQRALKKDKDYRKTWQANIAMSYVDAEANYKKRTGKTSLTQDDRIKIANEAAEGFLTLLCA